MKMISRDTDTILYLIGFFVGLEKYGIDVFYNRKYQKWLFNNSTDSDKNIHPEFNINGFITNTTFTPFENSIALIEEDFINEQFQKLNNFDLNKLKPTHIRIIRTYERFLNEKINQLKQPKTDKSDEVLKNEFNEVFENDFAFTLFNKMKGFYVENNTLQADYSFLFDIMKKEGFIICSGVKFIDFLKGFDICITKIDSSKTGNKQKTLLYNATKVNLQKKHGLSTI
jgi:hypothetical protein